MNMGTSKIKINATEHPKKSTTGLSLYLIPLVLGPVYFDGVDQYHDFLHRQIIISDRIDL